jgi:peptidoglycan/xylan/chitin deacetylase (PgdA/CDA1 family)
VINLCFHGIGAARRPLEAGEEHYWISEAVYEQVLDQVSGRSDIALSFDDGNASDIEIGLPGLVDRGLSATFFVLAGRIDTDGSLSSSDVSRLASSGMSIGLHGMDHVPWRGLDEGALRRELDDARSLVESAAGETVAQAACPLGQYDRRILSQLKSRGYEKVFTSDRRRARASSWLQPRYSLTSDTTMESLQTDVLQPAALARRARLVAVGIIKRLR